MCLIVVLHTVGPAWNFHPDGLRALGRGAIEQGNVCVAGVANILGQKREGVWHRFDLNDAAGLAHELPMRMV